MMKEETIVEALKLIEKMKRGSVNHLPERIGDLKGRLEQMLVQDIPSKIAGFNLTDKIDYKQMREIAKVMYPNEDPFELINTLKERLHGEEIFTNQEFYDGFQKFSAEDRKKLGEVRINIIFTYFRYVNL